MKFKDIVVLITGSSDNIGKAAAIKFAMEEVKIEVLEGGYLSRYGQLDNPGFKKKVITLEKTAAI